MTGAVTVHFDDQAEQIVLGGWLNAIPSLEQVAADYFNPSHAVIFDVCRSHLEDEKPLELVSVCGTLSDRGRDDLVPVATDCCLAFCDGDISGLDHYVARLRELEHQRRLKRELSRSVATLDDPQLDYQERIEAVSVAVSAALEARHVRSLGSMDTIADQALEMYDRNTEQRKQGVRPTAPTGIDALDEAVGGLAPGRLIVFGARTGYGKTTVACDFALNAAEAGHSVAIISLEQPSLELALGLLQKRSGITPAEAREGLIDRAALVRELDEMRALPILIEAGGFNLRALSTLIRRIQIVHKADVILVDYVQLVSNRLQGQTRATEVAGISAELKRLAVDLDVCIVACAQLNKGPEDREDGRPQIRDIRESEAIAHDADSVLFLVRPDLRDRGASPYLVVAKNRHGKTVERIPLLFDPTRNRYGPMSLRAVG